MNKYFFKILVYWYFSLFKRAFWKEVDKKNSEEYIEKWESLNLISSPIFTLKNSTNQRAYFITFAFYTMNFHLYLSKILFSIFFHIFQRVFYKLFNFRFG